MQKSIVEKKFDKLTKDAYAFLRLVGVEYNTFAKTAEYAFLYPESFAQQVAKGQAVIETALQKVLASPLFANSFCFTGSHFDAKIFETRFFEMLKAHPSIASDVTKERLSLSQKDGKILVTLKLESSVWEYAKSEKVNFAGQIKDQLYYQYCEEFEIVLQDRGIDHKARQDNVLRVGQDTTAQLEREGGREIVVSGVEILVGKLDTFAKSIPKMAVGKVGERAGGLEQGDDHGEQILDTTLCATAQYIVDCKDTPKKSVVVCGDVAFFEVAVSKAGKTYVKLELNDKTSTLKGMFFPKSNQMEQLSPLLQDGQFVYGTQLLVSGEIKPDTLRNDGSTTFFVNNIAKCVLPKDFVVNRKIRPTPLAYTTIHPKPFVDTTTTQMTLDALGGSAQPQRGKQDNKTPATYVVFDLETTGIGESRNHILDIGAVKIVDGVIVETFESLVDPLCKIPPESIEIHHITDAMVAGQPTIEPVLLDFLLFVQGATLVAHNIDFDYNFVAYHGKKFDMYFENPRLDTLAMARRLYPRLANHKLGTICEHLGIVNNTAHRALSDAVATAHAFLQMQTV